ncbi:hypothetical protein BHE74_00052944 [Ensete ventricosum]|nr:hypothetical protein BHE74_00052944 [Ensete ventricosum]
MIDQPRSVGPRANAASRSPFSSSSKERRATARPLLLLPPSLSLSLSLRLTPEASRLFSGDKRKRKIK